MSGLELHALPALSAVDGSGVEGSPSVTDLVGVIGVLLFCAGVNVLWLARHEMLYWVDLYLSIFRRSFDAAIQKPAPAPDGAGPPSPPASPLEGNPRHESGGSSGRLARVRPMLNVPHALPALPALSAVEGRGVERSEGRGTRHGSSLLMLLCGVGLMFLGLGVTAFVILERIL